ncbi:c-type cytochrome biogenesis protein CcmI [Aestuariicella hydrocarbonica]|uniref:C-type cytochrome biogenesis protein CcmI n=1 Tax=Pseudomaricurvus hydrocarbonicus TaxID=1470433 RepID=A0A9E5MKK1_9GAMM|nr:c-type cytochrome biogenesis protein CcmI [Aestuariicella hydrocarbonica]NHO65482.1 c-type cytochrome biogenesis protein CcmI [Aestuariicella hydrocarbonica]
MVSFWLIVAVMTLAAAFFVLWPLWRQRQGGEDVADREALVLDLFNEHLQGLERQFAAGELDQAQFEQLKTELELSLLEDITDDKKECHGHSRWGLYAAVVLLPAVAFGLYWKYGSINDVDIVLKRQAYFQEEMQAAERGELSSGQALQGMVDSLEKRIAQAPDNLGNRYLLARAYMQSNDYVKAVGQYTYIAQNNDAPANVLGELAQAVFLAAGNRVTPEVEILVARALEKEPNEATSLGLAGIGAFERAQYAEAIQYWQRAVQVLGVDSPGAQSLMAGIQRAYSLMPEAAAPPAVLGQADMAAVPLAPQGQTVGTGKQQDTAAQASIQVQVSVADGVEVAPSDTVFVYVRAWKGAKMPLAIRKVPASELPATIILDETMAMAPGVTLTSFPRLEVVARISRSGAPVPQSGDWQATFGPVILAELDGPLSLSVNQQIP